MADPEIRSFQASDGYEHRYRFWATDGEPLADVVALHGIQSHSGWYDYSSRCLAHAGFAVHFLDRRGSGLNACQRGHTPGSKRLVQDVVEFLRFVCRTGPDAPARDRRPLVLMAVSWGGRLAVVVAAEFPRLIDRLVLMYPGIRTKIDVSTAEKLRILWAAVTGRFGRRVPIPLDEPALFTADPDWQDFIRNDPLALHCVTVSFLLAHRKLSRLAERGIGRIRCPVLLMLAGRDRIVDNVATRRLIERVPADRRTVFEYPDAHHTLEFEPNREQIFSDLIQWLRT